MIDALVAARELGLVGPGAVEAHIAHARGFAEVARELPATPAVDLGSGGGVPGLILAVEYPSSSWALVDGRARSTRFLGDTVRRLGLEGRVEAIEARAETLGHEPAWRASTTLVVARGFGPPAVTAECAAGLLAVGGRMVVSEPPGSEGDRWPPGPLAALGMALIDLAVSAEGFHYAVVEQERLCPPQFPRRVGVPARRPLFT